MRRRPLLIALGLVGLVVLALLSVRILTRPDTSAGERFEIVGDESIGGFPTDGSTGQALDHFGPPSRRQHFGRGCDVQWRDRGMRTFFAFEGRQDEPCGRGGWHSSTTVRDPRWTTDRGLKVGDTEARARELYPDLNVSSDGIATLLSREVNGLLLPSLTAQLKNGRVASLTVRGPPRAF